MPYRDKPIEKKYYSIKEVAEMIHHNQSTVRFWEDTFDWIHPARDRKGNRRYKKKDIVDIMVINILVKLGGMTLDGIETAHQMGYLEEMKLFFLEKHRNFQGPKQMEHYAQPTAVDEVYSKDDEVRKSVKVEFFIKEILHHDLLYWDDDPDKLTSDVNEWISKSPQHTVAYID